jgi:anti-sigma B factor antagonist
MKITAREDGDQVIRISLAGELDMGNAASLDVQVAEVVAARNLRLLIVDAGRLEFCDSSGIHAFLRAQATAHRHGAAFMLADPVGITRTTLQITGLLDSLTTISHPRPDLDTERA